MAKLYKKTISIEKLINGTTIIQQTSTINSDDNNNNNKDLLCHG